MFFARYAWWRWSGCPSRPSSSLFGRLQQFARTPQRRWHPRCASIGRSGNPKKVQQIGNNLPVNSFPSGRVLSSDVTECLLSNSEIDARIVGVGPTYCPRENVKMVR